MLRRLLPYASHVRRFKEAYWLLCDCLHNEVWDNVDGCDYISESTGRPNHGKPSCIQAVTPNEPVAEAKTPQINEKVATVDRVATKSTKRNQPGDQKRCIRKKKKMTPEHIEYIKNIQRAEKEDASSGKFKKRGPIVIPKSPTVSELASRADEETNTPLHNVIYDPSDNEVFDIGTQVDEIETQPQAASNDSEVAKKSSVCLRN
ncbi:unnamed protein product [Caenorhabditis auriculariae]|uniref:Uncharacterized protein n=1 Tax=Caenorhabditis auriculariae TaxID=2777116 RepID=A0A8S1HJ56_9PELO|nr:unnamed protein product [Caenorhabditis auriculariae]